MILTRHVLPAFVAGLFSIGVAQAADAPSATPAPTADMKAVRLAAANQLGVLEYCQSRGDISAETLDIQRKIIAMLPPPADAGEAAAEQTGKGGTVSMGGQTISIEDAAKRQQTTPTALCKQMETMLKQNMAQMNSQMNGLKK
ncbi:Hypothetical protein GbCGDNIH6_2282 [Granulibacter bethesdensis]|uniref:pore-forming ESAT-6 family protein n=1 Tax=Granulibacter bethesdensis TaxID=364410 RepID=UPI00090B6B03|nr:pore-forming ESAT-6 family protein [Granulibacter bethesdensis]APH58120.1 Hypothetical protein GbCGDNIH6_2282 [Granulibacter bethesdensis]